MTPRRTARGPQPRRTRGRSVVGETFDVEVGPVAHGGHFVARLAPEQDPEVGGTVVFEGKVADIDQSKVWPAGTCLGIDPSTNQPTDIPIDCAAPHAMEVTGAVNLAEKFPAGLPPESEQDSFIKDACTRMTDAYLAPIQLRSTTLTLIYSTISLPTWSAGSARSRSSA